MVSNSTKIALHSPSMQLYPSASLVTVLPFFLLFSQTDAQVSEYITTDTHYSSSSSYSDVSDSVFATLSPNRNIRLESSRFEVIKSFATKLMAQSTDASKEMLDAANDNFWDLI